MLILIFILNFIFLASKTCECEAFNLELGFDKNQNQQ